ncbi:MAG: hypothetical protein AAFR66_04400 [Bacteroidota bacterium]
MDFQIIQFLDYQFFRRENRKAENTFKEFTEEEEKLIADYRFIIREYIKWEKGKFAKRVAAWEKEAMVYQIRAYSFRHCA